MDIIVDYPIAMFLVTVVVTAIASELGVLLVTRGAVQVGDFGQFSVIQTATLTLLGLVIGFTFAMAVSRYDQRKNLEEEEANAIGTEYLRVALLPEANTSRARARLRQYLDQRIAWYSMTGEAQLRDLDAATARTQDALWDAVRVPVAAQQNSVMALVAAGMNTVINAQGYVQAAWWNRIPHAGWLLLLLLSFCANLLVGMGAQAKGGVLRKYSIPLGLAVTTSFGLIAVAP